MAHASPSSTAVPCPEEALFVELVRTTDLLSRGAARLMKGYELSATQYNVLRILRGSPEGLPCGEVAQRMITRDPDITRLLDRLEKRGLISRLRQQEDRRMVVARITAAGLELLARIDGPVRELHRTQLGHLSQSQREQLAELLTALRAAL